MKFLFIVFFMFLFLIFLFGFSIIRGIFRLFFGGMGHKRYANQQREQQAPPESKKNNKVFTKEEGEYVDYVEIKEPESKS